MGSLLGDRKNALGTYRTKKRCQLFCLLKKRLAQLLPITKNARCEHGLWLEKIIIWWEISPIWQREQHKQKTQTGRWSDVALGFCFSHFCPGLHICCLTVYCAIVQLRL
jgi:hypothetical protein